MGDLNLIETTKKLVCILTSNERATQKKLFCVKVNAKVIIKLIGLEAKT